MIEVNVKCPHCGESLMDEEIKIDDHPSVKVNIQWRGERGRLRLSSLYGSYTIECQLSTVEICSRRGCKKHLIEFENLESELRAFYNKYSLFFKRT